MSLTQTIHERWAADGTLSGLLAAARVSTGIYQAQSLGMPFCVILRPGDGDIQVDNTEGATDEAAVHFVLRHEDYDSGLAISRQIRTSFHRTKFALDGGDQVLSMHRAPGYSEIQDADTGAWVFTMPFACITYTATGEGP